jgi:anti-sigma factor RsiW
MTDRDGLPSDPVELQLLLHALADGELDAAGAYALERRLGTDRSLAMDYARIVALRGAMQKLSSPQPSEDLRRRVAAIGGEVSVSSRRDVDWRALAATVLITGMLAGGGTYWAMTRTAPDELAGEIASAHRRALIAAAPIDIASSDRHQIKPWLDTKIGLSPPANDFTAEGYVLVGARIDVIGSQIVPTLVYRHNEHLISVVAMPPSASYSPAPAPRDLSARGFSLVRWEDSAFTYWAISDLERTELDAFVRLFKSRAAEKS